MTAHRRALVLLDSVTAREMPDKVAALERQGAIVKLTDYGSYSRLMGQVEEIRRLLREHDIDFLLFSRNDQVFGKVNIGPLIRALRVGYSSFSGIDTEQAVEQTRACLQDYLRSPKSVETHGAPEGTPYVSVQSPKSGPGGLRTQYGRFANRPYGPSAGESTFSLIFDLEQLGCARVGLPRILDLLEQYGVRATFFTTNFIPEVHPDIPEAILSRGHEIGLHGQYHEYLSGHPLARQTEMIRQMICDFGPAVPISGANFVYRMDSNTVEAMIANGLSYFVMFMEHRYSPFTYRKMPLRPYLTWSPRGTIWMVPISVETNSRPWNAVKRMIDSAHIAGRAEKWPHMNILLHPFRDGTLRHIRDLQRLLEYVQGKLGYKGIPVSDVVKELPKYEPASLVYYDLDNTGHVPANKRFWRGWWEHTARYEQRISRLYQELATSGRSPALCLSQCRVEAQDGQASSASLRSEVPAGTQEAPWYAVYPHLPEWAGQVHVIENDPLSGVGGMSDSGERSGIGSADGPTPDRPPLSLIPQLYAFEPGGYGQDMVNAARTLRPRFRQDYTGLIPEVGLRAAYRLSRGRHIF